MSDNKNFKKCPFCGESAKEEQTRGSFGGYGLTTIYCQNCGSSAPNKRKWNRRVDNDEPNENIKLPQNEIIGESTSRPFYIPKPPNSKGI